MARKKLIAVERDRELKTGNELNNRYELNDGNYSYVQYYEGIDSYYVIVHHGSTFTQGGLDLKQLRQFLLEYCSDKNAIYKS